MGPAAGNCWLSRAPTRLRTCDEKSGLATVKAFYDQLWAQRYESIVLTFNDGSYVSSVRHVSRLRLFSDYAFGIGDRLPLGHVHCSEQRGKRMAERA